MHESVLRQKCTCTNFVNLGRIIFLNFRNVEEKVTVTRQTESRSLPDLKFYFFHERKVQNKLNYGSDIGGKQQ